MTDANLCECGAVRAECARVYKVAGIRCPGGEGPLVSPAETVPNVASIASDLSGTDAGELLRTRGEARIATYCRSSDALVAAGLWTDDGCETETGAAVREILDLWHRHGIFS